MGVLWGWELEIFCLHDFFPFLSLLCKNCFDAIDIYRPAAIFRFKYNCLARKFLFHSQPLNRFCKVTWTCYCETLTIAPFKGRAFRKSMEGGGRGKTIIALVQCQKNIPIDV